jgi:hypothetical protein
MTVVEFLARLLEPQERAAVLGDIAESAATSRAAAWDVAGLVLRRRAGVWVALLPAAALVTWVMVRFGSNVSTHFFVLRNYADLDPGILRELGMTKRDILRKSLEGAWPPVLASLIAGFVLAKLSGRALWLNATFFFAASVATLFYWRPPQAQYAPFLTVALQIVQIWIPLVIGTRLKKRKA